MHVKEPGISTPKVKVLKNQDHLAVYHHNYIGEGIEGVVKRFVVASKA